MKIKIFKNRRLPIIVMLLLFSLPLQAQFGEPDEDEDGDGEPLDPAASIDAYMIPMLLFGVFTGWYLIARKNKLPMNTTDK